MAGNVREWCYPVAVKTYRGLAAGTQDPQGLEDAVITRGASYQDTKKEGRTHYRVDRYKQGALDDVGPGDRTTGFRPVLTK